ncbi:hypothetical protein [Xanthomonas phage BUDD]|nr:hypothetical protein [Xanthomonas phage BUDD]
MAKDDFEERVDMIKLLVNELDKELSDLNVRHNVDYKLGLQVQDKHGNYVLGAEESSDWSASWC